MKETLKQQKVKEINRKFKERQGKSDRETKHGRKEELHEKQIKTGLSYDFG